MTRALDEPGGREAESEADRNDYCHLLEAVLNLEGDIHWAEDLIGPDDDAADRARRHGRGTRMIAVAVVVVVAGPWVRVRGE